MNTGDNELGTGSDISELLPSADSEKAVVLGDFDLLTAIESDLVHAVISLEENVGDSTLTTAMRLNGIVSAVKKVKL